MSTAGGALIELTGYGFTDDVEVYLSGQKCAIHDVDVGTYEGVNLCEYDGVRCGEGFVNYTHIYCISNPQTYGEGVVQVKIPSLGNALTDLKFAYGDKWSNIRTWGSGWPKKNDWLYIGPEDVVIVDMTPPPLAGIILEGGLVWEDSGDYNLTTGYIAMNGGWLQIGTEENPFQNDAVITLTGTRESSRELPIFVTHDYVMGDTLINPKRLNRFFFFVLSV